MGKYTSQLGFEILGGERLNTVVITGTCDHPHIASDFRNVFFRKVKARPQTPNICRQFIVNDKVFAFGPLLMNKDATGAHGNTARILSVDL